MHDGSGIERPLTRREVAAAELVVRLTGYAIVGGFLLGALIGLAIGRGV